MRLSIWVTASLALFASTLGAKPQIQNIQAEGNLAVTHVLGCMTLDQFKNEYTPADLYPAIAKCIREKRFDDAFQLYAISGVYGRYDSLRVTDATAHQAVDVLQMEAFGDFDNDVGEKLVAAGSKVMDDPAAKAVFCYLLYKIGPPNYYPRYMVQHGIGAFVGPGGNGLVKDFNSDKAFKEALASYMHCEIG